MKKCANAQGFTIVETMIFLVITGILLVSALALFNGRISRTQFANSVRELDAQIRTVSNDVASGLYIDNQQFNCTANSGTGPRLDNTPSTNGQGTNTDCVFLGKVIQFGPAKANCSTANHDGCDQIGIITVVGQRHTSDDKEVTTLAEAEPLAIAPGTAENPDDVDVTNTITLPSGLHVDRVIQQTPAGPCPCNVGAFGIMQTLGEYGGSDLVTGSQKLQVLPVPSTLVGDAQTSMSAAIRDNLAGAAVNPGVVVCLISGTSNQLAAIKIGSSGREITTDTLVDSPEVVTLCS